MLSLRIRIVLLLIAFCLPATMPLQASAQKMWDLPTNLEGVDKVVSAENLQALAATTEDADVLLGLAYLVRPGDPLRAELAQRAIKAKPEYAPAAAVVAVMMDGATDQTVAQLLERDPENALGHYLQGGLHYQAERDAEAVESFRKAAALRELKLYLPESSSALFKALDALGLQGRERLCALSWMATRMSNFGISCLQDLPNAIGGSARRAQNVDRAEVSEMLLVLGGHLARTNFNYRWFGQRALMSAFRAKAEVAAEEGSPAMHGYAAATQALLSASRSWPQIDGGQDIAELSLFVPNRISFAFKRLGPGEPEMRDVQRNLPDADRAGFEKARQAAKEAAEVLIAAAEDHPDEIVGAYLTGMIEPRELQPMPWVPRHTYVERAMERHPEAFRAALAYDRASQALRQAGANDPKQRNISRLLSVGHALIAWNQRNEGAFPPSFDVLVEIGFLEQEATKSVHTGRPFVYVVPDKLPEREWDTFVLAYDDHELEDGYQVVFASGGGATMPADWLRKHLESRGKQGP